MLGQTITAVSIRISINGLESIVADLSAAVQGQVVFMMVSPCGGGFGVGGEFSHYGKHLAKCQVVFRSP